MAEGGENIVCLRIVSHLQSCSRRPRVDEPAQEDAPANRRTEPCWHPCDARGGLLRHQALDRSAPPTDSRHSPMSPYTAILLRTGRIPLVFMRFNKRYDII